MRLNRWRATNCQPVCIRLRFPERLQAEWNLAWLVHKRRDTFIPGPKGGGSILSDYEFSMTDFVSYVRDVARVPHARWEPLIARTQEIVSWWRSHREGKFPFDKKDVAELREIGLPVEAVIADAADGETDPVRS